MFLVQIPRKSHGPSLPCYFCTEEVLNVSFCQSPTCLELESSACGTAFLGSWQERRLVLSNTSMAPLLLYPLFQLSCHAIPISAFSSISLPAGVLEKSHTDFSAACTPDARVVIEQVNSAWPQRGNSHNKGTGGAEIHKQVCP